MRSILRRIATLEARKRLSFPQRVIVRYRNEGEPPPEVPEEACDDNTVLVIVEYADMPIGATGTAC